MVPEYLCQTVAKLVELPLPERELHHNCFLANQGRKGVVAEFNNDVVEKQLKGLDSPVARFALVIQLDMVSVQTERNILGLRRLRALQEQVALGVELGIRKPDEPRIRVFVDRHAICVEVAVHEPWRPGVLAATSYISAASVAGAAVRSRRFFISQAFS